MASDATYKVSVLADISGVKKAAEELNVIFTKQNKGGAVTSLRKQFQSAASVGSAVLEKVPKSSSDKASQSTAVVKGLETIRSTAIKTAKLMGSELDGAFARVLNTEEKVARQKLDYGVQDLKTAIKGTVDMLPKISSSLYKAKPVFREIAVEANGIVRNFKEQKVILDAQYQTVARLRKEYDAKAEVAATTGKYKDLQATLDKLTAAEEALKKKISEQEALVKQVNGEGGTRHQLEQKILAEVTKTAGKLGLTEQQVKNLTSAEQARLALLKQETRQEEFIRIAKQKQADIDVARRQAYSITIAGNQVKQYGQNIANLASQSATAFSDVDYQARRAAAAMDAPVGMVDELTNAAKRSAEAIGYFSSADISKGMYFFASTTGVAVNSVNDLNNMMSQLTPIMKAAAITSSDLESTIKGVYGIINQFGMQKSNAGTVIEELYYAAQKTAAELPDFIESLKMLGPVAAQAGVSFEEILRSLGTLANSGIKGTMAGRALRQMFLQLNDPADRATTALDKAVKSSLGLNQSFKSLVFPKGQFIGMAGYIKTLAKVMATMNQEQQATLIGTIATAAETPALTQLLKDEIKAFKTGTTTIKEYTVGIGDAAVASKFFQSNVKLVGESTQASLGRINNSITNIKATFGKALAPAIESFSKSLASVATSFDTFAKANPDTVKMIGNLTVLSGILLTVGGSAMILFGSFRLITKAALPEISLLLNGVRGVGEEMSIVGRAGGLMSLSFKGAFASIGGIFKGLLGPLRSFFLSISIGGLGAIKNMFSLGGLVSRVGGGFLGFFKAIGIEAQIIITFFAGIITGFVEALNAGNKSGKGISGAFEGVGAVIGSLGKILGIVADAFNILFEVARTVGIGIGKLFAKGGPLEIVGTTIGGIFGTAGTVIDWVSGAFKELTAQVKRFNDEALDPNKARIREIQDELNALYVSQSRGYGDATGYTAKRIQELEAERLKLQGLEAQINSTFEAYQTWGANSDIRAARARIVPPVVEDKKTPPLTDTSVKQTAQQKALELAQQAASLAEALYKLEGVDLKALVNKAMGGIAEAMNLAIKYAAPYAKQFKTTTLDKVGQFADTVGKMASAISGMAEAALAMQTYKAPTPAAMKKIIADISNAMKYMITEAKKFAGGDVIRVQAYADAVSSVVGSIGAAVQSFNSMAKGVYQPPEAVLRRIAVDISKAVSAFVAQLKSAPTDQMLEKAQKFASAADAALGTISNAVSAFKDLRKFVKPLPADLQAVVDTIELGIRRMIISMGKFSLNQDQWDVVNTFANVAKAVSDAVSGTYDAFVKQFDFVQQFRTEIDYNKVFGWIEMGIKKMADIASSMPVGMIDMAKDAADAAQAIAGALSAFFDLAAQSGGQPGIVADSLQIAVNSVLAIIEAFASSTNKVGESFVDTLIHGMQSRESALAAEAARLNQILGTVGGSSSTRGANATMTITHVISDPNGALKDASAADVAALLNGDKFISNLKHSINTQ